MLHLLLLITAFVLLSVPLRHLTGSARAQPGASEPQLKGGQAAVVEGAEVHPEEAHRHRLPVRIRLRYAHAPESMSLRMGERELLKGVDQTKSPVECEVAMELGHEGNELVLEGVWPVSTPDTAVTVELEPDGLEMRSETRWSEGGAVSDVLTFVW
jgi:hypothetical protein